MSIDKYDPGAKRQGRHRKGRKRALSQLGVNYEGKMPRGGDVSLETKTVVE